MALTPKQVANLYRPQGPKALLLGTAWSSNGKMLVSGPQIDLSTGLEGFRIVFKIRDVIGVANMTTPSPFGYFNLIKRIFITGKNSRANGNVTLWDIDAATLAAIQSAHKKKPYIYSGVTSTGGPAGAGVFTESISDAMSTPITGLFTGATGTYDILWSLDLPAYPFHCSDYLKPGYVLRSNEWGDSLQIRIEFGGVTSGSDGALGTDAGTTTHTFTARGSASGSGTVDIYGLPVLSGTAADNANVPGYLSRVATPVTTTLQSAGGLNTKLVTLEKQNTTKIFTLIGTSTTNPTFLTTSDTNLTTLGMLVGGNRIVRENDDIFAHKQDQVRHYGTQPIQGLTMFDFAPAGNPMSNFSASEAGAGTTLELRGTVAGVANAQGIFVQETEQFAPAGLYAA